MLFSKLILSTILSACLIKSEEIDTTITSTITITKTLYTPEESASMEAEYQASIASVASVEAEAASLASVAAAEAQQASLDAYYESLASETQAIESATETEVATEQSRNYSITYVTVTVIPEKLVNTSSIDLPTEIQIDTEITEDPIESSSQSLFTETVNEIVTIAPEESEDAGYVHGISAAAGIFALIAAIL
ncbi:uncharacterized protein KGF55_000133 [Candida pseudojiufengensis]|uniref:uncharacterized protein n=1 Tax=Candida pseudojiufengensis TaxID=497109 RepID=UPI00222401D3|nr:uncharacterized protein KGF55_000133 [Candida pseudojiufengensis]KAI5966724.1 hypothetical protein KGF55_000133 [Candida pseudojiufengensis]